MSKQKKLTAQKRAARERRSLVRKLDAIVREIILWRDGGRCITCGSTEKLTASHYIARKPYATRWLLINVWTQCSSCNSRHNFSPEELRAAIVKRVGEKAIEVIQKIYLQSRSTEPHLRTSNLWLRREYERLLSIRNLHKGKTNDS